MAFSVKDWKDFPNITTPTTAVALEDMETRLSAYSDTAAAAVTKSFRTPHGFTILGSITAAMNLAPCYVSKESGETLTIEKIRYSIRAGTNATFKLQKGGSDLTGYGTTASPLTATTTAATTTSSQTLADDDALTLVIVAVTGSPTEMAVTLSLKHVV